MFEVISKYKNGFEVIVLRTNSLVNAIEFANQLENNWQIQTEQGKIVIETDMEMGMEFRQDIRPIALMMSSGVSYTSLSTMYRYFCFALRSLICLKVQLK